MRTNILHNEGDRYAVVRVDNLVLTISHDHQGYELLVEVDTDENATVVPVNIGTAIGDSVEWEL